MAKPAKFIKSLFQFNSNKSENDGEELEKLAAKEQKVFTFQALVAATGNFDDKNKLGQGGFGPVYKGKLKDDEKMIAVKKLSRGSSQGKKEFANEAKLLARVQHRNIVGLLGYCVHGEEKLLVYEFVVNESLDKFLFGSSRQNVLDWKRRYDIIGGLTRGLLYLHEDSHSVIIHRDIKASNILLDDKWVPKIADFGMARLFPEDETHVNTRVAGTNGYMAPEYLMHGHLSAKADVFSFGAVLLELITSQKNSTFTPTSDAQSLLEWAYKLYKKGKSLEIVDPTLASSAVPEQVVKCIKIGLLCVQSDPQLRPTMRRVEIMLSKKPDSLEEPTRPGCPGSRYRRRSHRPTQSTSGVDNSLGSDSNTFSSSATYTTSSSATTSNANGVASTSCASTSTANAVASTSRAGKAAQL